MLSSGSGKKLLAEEGSKILKALRALMTGLSSKTGITLSASLGMHGKVGAWGGVDKHDHLPNQTVF